jgi:hypothetical protein
VLGRGKRAGFRRLGDLAAADIGLPAARAHDLSLVHAWSAVAGEAFARRSPALGVRRGVLEIRLPEGPWEAIVAAEAGRLAARVARAHPELGIRRYRLCPEGGGPPRAAEAIDAGGVAGEGQST